VGIGQTSPAAKLEVEVDSANATTGILIDADDIDQIAFQIDAEQTTADIIDVDASNLTTGNLMEVALANTINTGTPLINIEGGAIDGDKTIGLIELQTTPANGTNVTAINIERGSNDARIYYDEENDKWQIDQGGGSGLVDIATGAAGADTALSNLASVAVNTHIIANSDSDTDLGSSTYAWENLYADNITTTAGTILNIMPADTYTQIGDAGTAVNVTANDDLYVSGAIEVDGSIYLNNTIICKGTGNEMSAGSNTISFVQQNITSAGGSATIDWANSNKGNITLTEDVSSLTFNAPTGPCNLLFVVKQDGTGGYNVTSWPGTVKWPGGNAPALTSDPDSVDIMSFYYDGTNYYGMGSLDFS